MSHFDSIGGTGSVHRERFAGGSNGHAVFTLDREGRIDSWSDTAADLYGYGGADVVGRDPAAAIADSGIDAATLRSVVDEARTGPVVYGTWHERADGSVFWGTTTVSPIGDDARDGYTVVVQDTTPHEQYVRMLEHQNDRLKEFTDILAHDLRNPLNVIDGRLELFRDTGDPDHLVAIDRTTDRMERLIEDLLRIARNGDVVEDPEPTDITTIVRRAREGTVPGTAILDYDPVPTVMSDADRLCELFENLLRNAVEHARHRVTIAVGPLDDGFYVADDGPGIPEERRSKVFDHGFTTNREGNGFGLSLVRTIAGAHGWDVRATDSADGGARFEITGVEFVD